MATRYELNARITADNDTGAAFESFRADIAGAKEDLRSLNDTVNIGINIESAKGELNDLKREIKSFSEDVEIDVDLNTKKAKAEARAFSGELKKLFKDEKIAIDLDSKDAEVRLARFQTIARAAGKDIHVNIDVDAGTATAELIAFTGASIAAGAATEDLNEGVNETGTSVVKSARTLTASGFLVQLAAIPPIAGAILASLRPMLGSLAVVGSLGSSAAIGVGLLVAAGARLIRGMQQNAKWAQDLNKEWKALQSQFTGSSSVFDRAAKSLAPLGAQVLGLANKAMPALGKEANEVSKAVVRAFDNISRNVGGNEKNSLNRILDNASDVMESLVSAAGKAGAAIANIFGNRAVVKAAQDLADWIDEIAGRFLNWTQSEKGIETINGLVKDARTFMQDLGKAVEPVAKAIGKFGTDDVQTLGKMLQGTGKVIAAVINLIEDIFDVVGAAQKAMDKWNLQLKDLPKLFQNIGRALSTAQKAMTNFINNTGRAIGKWVSDAIKNVGKFTGDTAKALVKWAGDTLKNFSKWVASTLSAWKKWGSNVDKFVGDWIKNNVKDFVDWASDVVESAGDMASDFLDSISDWADDTGKAINDWIEEQIDRFTTWVGDMVDLMQDKFPEVMGAILDALDAALGPMDEWVGSAIDILNKIFDLLGVGPGDEGNDDAGGRVPGNTGGRRPGRGGRRGRRYEGGVYDDDVRLMASGGIVDSSGMATAMATGISQELARGSVWQDAVGGISDGLSPRVVYGEVAPDGQSGKEAYIREGRPVAEQLPYLVEAARWFGLQVGAGSDKPHAHLPESAAEKLFSTHPKNVVAMAPGGMLFGVPGGTIIADYQEYIPNYQFSADSRHKGIDVAGSEVYATYEGRMQDHPDWSAGIGAAIDFNTEGGDTQSMVHGHLSSAPAIGTATKPNMFLGNTTAEGYGWTPHLHLQAYTAPVLSTGYTHNEPPLTDPRNTWAAAKAGGDIPPPGSNAGGGFDVWGAVRKMVDGIGTPDLGGGPYFQDVASSSATAVRDAIMTWVKDHLPSFTLPWSDSGTAAGLAGWIKQGYEYAQAFEASAENLAKTENLAMEESGGDPNAQNPSGASGLMQMMPETFAAYEVDTSDDIWNPVDNAGASLRYQKDRYGYVVEHAPYTAGGIATQDQFARIAEHGPEFFMPLHDPESSRRFMSFLENAALERAEHGSLPWQRDPDMAGMSDRVAPIDRGASDEIVRLRGENSYYANRMEEMTRQAAQRTEDAIERQNELLDEMPERTGTSVARGYDNRLARNPQTREANRQGAKRDRAKSRSQGAVLRPWKQ